jgi:DNA-binding NarL/FixJ family response regulator
VRATRVIYVENDPALRGIMTTMLDASPEVEIVLSTGSPAEALAFADLRSVDVALLDLALGQGEMNGVDLGIAMRQRNSNLGIVIHSQYPLDFATERVPESELIGWSTLQKSGQMSTADLVELLKATAMGIGRRTHGDDGDFAVKSLPDGGELQRLTSRQRAIMGLTASGFSPQQIAEQLSMSYDLVRQDLARSYRILVPDEAIGDDRRTQAVLAYVRLTREELWESP